MRLQTLPRDDDFDFDDEDEDITSSDFEWYDRYGRRRPRAPLPDHRLPDYDDDGDWPDWDDDWNDSPGG